MDAKLKKDVMNSFNSLCYFIAFFILLLGQQSWALEANNAQPIEVNADSVSFNHQTGLSIYQGHVKLSQGTATLTADKLTAQLNTNNHLEFILAQGNPATYSTLSEQKSSSIFMQADSITYDLTRSKITLQGNAKAVQNQDSFAGPVIEYDTKQQILKTPPSHQGRTTIIFNPVK